MNYVYAPVESPPPQETKWHFGWNSCLLFLLNIGLLAFYAVVPGISFLFIWGCVIVFTALGILSAMMSIVFGRFWLSKVYATCGLVGNICLPLWLMLSL